MMFRKPIAGSTAKLAAIALVLQACTPNTPKANVPDGTITEVKLVEGAVSSNKILNGTILTEDIADAQITTAKLATGVNITGGSATFTGTLGVTGLSTLGSLGVTGVTTLTGAATLTGGATSAQTITVNKIDATNHVTNAGVFGVLSTMRAENTAASSELYYGSFNQAVAATPFTSAQMVGSHGQVAIPAGGAGAVITTGIGVNSILDFSAAGTITNGYAFHGSVDLGGVGTLTNYRGLFLEDPVAGVATYNATRYGVYSDGPINNYFAGRVGIGDATPDQQLDVVGSINASVELLINDVQMCTAAGCTAVSDMSLKEDVKPLDHSLEKVLGLKGISYYFKDKKRFGESRQIGFSAQELEKTFPQVVRTDDRTGIKSVAYGNLIAPLVESIKVLYSKWSADHKQLEQQKQQLASLERKIDIENIALKSENKALKERLDKIEHALALASPDKSLKPAAKRKLASAK